jgi:hypothetical protein
MVDIKLKTTVGKTSLSRARIEAAVKRVYAKAAPLTVETNVPLVRVVNKTFSGLKEINPNPGDGQVIDDTQNNRAKGSANRLLPKVSVVRGEVKIEGYNSPSQDINQDTPKRLRKVGSKTGAWGKASKQTAKKMAPKKVRHK